MGIITRFSIFWKYCALMEKLCVRAVCEILIVWNIRHTSHTPLPLFTYTVLLLDCNLFQEKKRGCTFCPAFFCDFLPNPIYILLTVKEIFFINIILISFEFPT